MFKHFFYSLTSVSSWFYVLLLVFFSLSNIHWWTYIDLEIRVTLPFKSQKKNDWKYNCYIWYYTRVYSLENSYTNYYFIIISYYFNTITANLPLNPFSGLNSVSHWLFIPTLLSGAPSARWVASNQNPTNVKLINEWKYHESYSLLSGMYYLFPPFTHLHISSSTGSLTGIQWFPSDTQGDTDRGHSIIRCKQVCSSFHCKRRFDGYVQSKVAGLFGFIPCYWSSVIVF